MIAYSIDIRLFTIGEVLWTIVECVEGCGIIAHIKSHLQNCKWLSFVGVAGS